MLRAEKGARSVDVQWVRETMSRPEILPPEEKALSLSENATRVRKLAITLSIGFLFSLALWCVGEFTSIRGIFSVLVSRVVLGVMWIVISLLGYVVATGLNFRRRYLMTGIWAGVWAIVVFCMDVYAPVPKGPSSRIEIVQCDGIFARNRNNDREGFALNVYYSNKGTIAAQSMTHRAVLVDSVSLLSEEHIKQYLDEAAAVSYKASADEIQPGDAPRSFFTIPNDDQEIEQLSQTAHQVLNNSRRLYLFAAFKYRDANTPKNKVRITQFCGWFMGTFNIWHNCGNRIYTIDLR